MNPEFEKTTSNTDPLVKVHVSGAHSPALLEGKLQVAGAFLLAATCVGCAASNYDFDALPDAGAPSRVARMSDDWVSENESGKDESLYDVKVFPLAHTSLNVFAEVDEEGIPDGFVEADIDAYLPLFGFLDVDIKRYDSDRRLYEQQEYNSYLWGLFQTHKELIETEVGLREEKRRRFLWFLGWNSSPKYID